MTEIGGIYSQERDLREIAANHNYEPIWILNQTKTVKINDDIYETIVNLNTD